MPTVTASPTPNPNSLKFSANGATFLESGLEAFNSANDAENHPLGRRLFALDGVQNVFIVPQFVTVTKHPAASWTPLAEAIERVLLEHLAGSAGE